MVAITFSFGPGSLQRRVVLRLDAPILVPYMALDLSLRKADDPLPVFEKVTGKSPDELWSEYKSEMSP